MTNPFTDHFGRVSGHYARHRPTYPPALFEHLAALSPAHELAWDCATGSGQAALDLARLFQNVVATDMSLNQIRQATPHPRIAYRIAPAEASSLPDHRVDLITVAQALHWFQLDAFYAEVRRVLKPGGLLAVWCYGLFSADDPQLTQALHHFYHDVVGPYWPPERRHIDNGYAELPFSFEPVPLPPLKMTVTWDQPHLLGYLRSWSACGRFIQTHGHDPVTDLEKQLTPLWREPHTLYWPLTIKAGRV